MALSKKAESICRKLGMKDGLQSILNIQAVILKDRGDFNGALSLHKESEHISREAGLMDGLWRSLHNQVLVLFYKRNDPLAARPKCEEAIRILRETGLAPDFLRNAQAILAQIKARL